MTSFTSHGAIIALPSGKLLIGWGKESRYSSVEEAPHAPLFFVTDFFLKEKKPWISFSQSLIVDFADCKRLLTEMVGESNEFSHAYWDQGEKELFDQSFHLLQEQIAAKRLIKGVLYHRFSASVADSSRRVKDHLLRAIAFAQKGGGYVYGYWNRDEGFIGVTPEKLFEKKALGCIATMALAGTATLSNSDDLLNDLKEMNEHIIVIEGIKNQLNSFGDITTGKTTVLKLPSMQHLYTPIELKLKHSFNFNAIVDALHPTAALGAWPKESGMEWLKQIDTTLPRRFFGAPFGCSIENSGIMTCLVAIRNVSWNNHCLFVYSGCGIVSSSILEREWDEVCLKAKKTMECFGYDGAISYSQELSNR